VDADFEQWLLEEMAALVRRAGAGPFVAAPLLRSDDAHFPDDYDGDVVGVRTFVRRVLRHAGLGDLHVDLEVVQDAAVSDSLAPVLFASVDHGRITFELHGDPPARKDLVDHLVFEAGHAFRACKNLDTDEAPYRDRVDAADDVVEQRAAVTAVYLGFGIIAANAAHHYESKAPARDLQTHADYHHKMVGSLAPEAIAWLLALQVVVRGSGEETVRQALSPNQRAAFSAAIKELEPRRDALIDALGLTGEAEWPSPASVDLDELEVEEADVELFERQAARDAEANEKRKRSTVYPVDTTRPWSQVIIVALIAGGIVGPIVYGATGVGILGWIFQIATAVLIAVWLRGARPPECSDTGCRATLPEGADTCPGCGARIVTSRDG
jgi:hypothetical protein